MSSEEQQREQDEQLRRSLIVRIFYMQLALVLISTLMVPACVTIGLGWFWFAFMAGVFGSSIALLRKVTRGGDIRFLDHSSWPLMLSPLLFGGILAGIAYFVMASGLISGADGDGLLKTNLFPSFGPEAEMNELAQLSKFLAIRPSALQDAAKLVIWCLIAGYSEHFITGLLSTLESRASSMLRSDSDSARNTN